MSEIVKQVVPIAWEAFKDYVLYAERFSKKELQVIAEQIDPQRITKENLLNKDFENLEADEFLEKINNLGK